MPQEQPGDVGDTRKGVQVASLTEKGILSLSGKSLVYCISDQQQINNAPYGKYITGGHKVYFKAVLATGH